MSSNISDFRQRFLRDLQLASRYKLNIYPGMDLDLPPRTDLYAESIILPGRNLEFSVDEIWGPVRKIPHARTYEYEAVLTIPLQGKWGIRKYFEDWMNKLVFPKDGKWFARVPYEGTISDSIVKLIPQTINDETATIITLYEAYPINILPIEMGQNLQNIYSSVMVLMAFREYLTD